MRVSYFPLITNPGGNLDVSLFAADAYAAILFDIPGSDISYIQACADRDRDTLDLDSIKIVE